MRLDPRRLVPRRARRQLPEQRWRQNLPEEVGYWRNWFASGGDQWPDDYRQRLDPDSELQPEVRELVDAPEGARVRIIDVGSGPLTWLGKRWPGRTLQVTAVDPLAKTWAELLAAQGVRPAVAPEEGTGEHLTARFPRNHYDIAVARYSLDESYDPLSMLREMIAVVRPGGAVLISSRRRAGESEGYWGLQQWNLDIEAGGFTLEGDGTRVDLAAAVAPTAAVEVSQPSGAGWIRVVLRKR